ncbi:MULTISPECIES: DMT family transporter [Alistipes]|uniref:DMT family transporter n=1 Tax=Alistipes TaxID=239759 RepID=UPI001DA1ED88|nr:MULTISPECIES: DMT family transporter [Alistipes]MBS1364764.1 DMT family transporter [Alistipes sp.]HJG75052.1 DMT family transporter [Alistipes ihumii]
MSNVVKAHLGLILSYVIWAVNYPLYKVIMPHYISPYAMTMLVVGVAALLAFGSMLFVPIEPVRRQDILKLVAAAALMGIAKKLFLMVGIQHTSPIDASIIATLGPILVLVISVMFLVDRFTPMKVLGMALGLAGALVVILSGSGMQAPSDKLGGDAVVLLAIVASSFSMVWLKELIVRYKPVTLLRWIYPVAAVMMLPIGLGPLLRTDFSAMPAHVAWIVAYVAVVPTFGPNYLLIYSLHYVKPTISSIYFYLEPVIATAISVAMHMDTLSWDRALASLAVFAGVLLVVLSYKNRPSTPRHTGE